MHQIPIVLFHKSEHIHVSYALRNASKHNAHVAIITDVNTPLYNNFAQVENIRQLPDESAKQFAGVYKHLSSNSHQFEFTAIEKYFFLLEYMKKYKSEKIIYIDSDVLIYENLSPLMDQYFAGLDLCSSIPHQVHEDFFWSASGHLSMWSLPAMEQFCAFILDTYTNDQELFDPKWNWHQENKIPGGINDMTLIYLFQRTTSLKTGNFMQTFDNRFTFDNAIKSNMNEFPEEYEMEHSVLMGGEIKKIIFRDGYPYGSNRLLRKSILFYILHFQGDAKKMMPLYARIQREWKDYVFLSVWILKLIYAHLRALFA